MRYIGIDYGEKRVGLAISDDTATLAFPKAVLESGPGLAGEVLRIAKEEGAEKIIVGQSHNFAGEPNPIQASIDKFIDQLLEQGELEVVLEPEFLSSAGAERVQGKNSMLDASSAAIILQSYLDKNNNNIS